MTIQERWPLPWHYTWPPGHGPLIVAANGSIVAVLSGGNVLTGAYAEEEVEGVGQLIAKSVNAGNAEKST